MEMTVVNANTGRRTGSAESRRLRRAGRLPGVVYGLGKDAVAVDVEYNALRDALKTDAGLNTVIALSIDGAENPVIVRSIQRDATSRLVIHTDFLRIDLDEKITVGVPVVLVGTPQAVIDAGSFVEQALFELEVLVKPGNIPDTLEVDISTMTPEAGFSVAEVVLPDDVEAVTPGHIAVATAVVTRAAKMADADDAAAEEAAEAEGEEGATEAAAGESDSGDSE